MPWGYGIDSFSIGCTIAELYLERPVIFWSPSHEERLAAIEKAIGDWGPAYAKEIEKTRPNTFSKITDSEVKVNFTHTCLTSAAKQRVTRTPKICVGVSTYSQAGSFADITKDSDSVAKSVKSR